MNIAMDQDRVRRLDSENSAAGGFSFSVLELSMRDSSLAAIMDLV